MELFCLCLYGYMPKNTALHGYLKPGLLQGYRKKQDNAERNIGTETREGKGVKTKKNCNGY